LDRVAFLLGIGGEGAHVESAATGRVTIRSPLATNRDGPRWMTKPACKKSASRGELVPAQETMPGGPKLEFEFVPHQNNIKAIYLRLDGGRIAYRGKPTHHKRRCGCR
jgi:hypothetical protein